MQLVAKKFPGILMLIRQNSDWVLTGAMVASGLLAGSWILLMMLDQTGLPQHVYRP